MTRRIITECPACTTRFQVTDGQLKIANGMVRCGTCLEVFNAELYNTNHSLPGADTASAKAPATQSSVDTSMHTSGQSLHGKDPVLDQFEVPEFIAPQTRQSGTLDNSYPSSHENDAVLIELLTQKTHSADPVTTESTNQTSTTNTAPVTKDAEPKLDLDKPIQEYISQQVIVSPEKTTGTDNTDITVKTIITSSVDLADEINLEQIINEPATLTQHPKLATKAQKKDTNAEKPLCTAANITTSEIKKLPPFTALRAEPVMIRTTQQPSGLSAWWTLSCLIAALLLASQYLWFNRVTLANQPNLANMYMIVCQEIECDLPVRQDIKSINTTKLVVQEHLEYQGVLSVNLLFENQAAYPQPYPAILLSFSDRKGIPISQRVFQPLEYLHESIVDLASMPVNQTLQISLDILDPGRRAVSYQTELRPASL